MIANVLCLLALALQPSCTDELDTPDYSDRPGIDFTLDRRNIDESNAYQIYYKPAAGRTGDLMPYYDPEQNIYRLFFLLDPPGNLAAHIWEYTTDDFRDFDGIRELFLPGGPNDQDKWIGTGSLIKKDGLYHFFYTGFNDTRSPSAKAMKATSTDLKNWTKIPESEFALSSPASEGYVANDFRDPCVIWDDVHGNYLMSCAGNRNQQGCIVRHTSDDLLNWTRIEPVLSSEMDADVWVPECPDVFKMGDKWYMVYAHINRGACRTTRYRIADNPLGPWRKTPSGHEFFDGLYFYAAKTAGNADERYVCGWASMGTNYNPNGEYSWGGCGVHHKIVQGPGGELYSTIPEAVDRSLTKPQECRTLKVSGNVAEQNGAYTLDASNGMSYVVLNRNAQRAKIELTIDASQAAKRFGVAFGAYDEQQDITKVWFNLLDDPFTISIIDDFTVAQPALYTEDVVEGVAKGPRNWTPLVVPEDRIFNVKIVLENRLCVMYVNDKIAYTNRIANLQENPWMIFAEEGVVEFKNIKVYD